MLTTIYSRVIRCAVITFQVDYWKSTYQYYMKHFHEYENHRIMWLQISDYDQNHKICWKCENSQYTHYSGIQLYTNLVFRRPYDKYLEEASFLETIAKGNYVVYLTTYFNAAVHLSKPKLNVSKHTYSCASFSLRTSHTKSPCIDCLNCVSVVCFVSLQTECFVKWPIVDLKCNNSTSNHSTRGKVTIPFLPCMPIRSSCSF